MTTRSRHGLIIEARSIKRAADAHGFSIDFKNLREYFRAICSNGGASLLKPVYVTMAEPREVESSLRKLLDWLSYNGYAVVETEYRYSGEERYGTPIVQLVHQMHMLARNVEVLHLFADDRDLAPVIRDLMSQGVRTTVYSTMKNDIVPEALRRAPDAFVDVETIADIVRQAR